MWNGEWPEKIQKYTFTKKETGERSRPPCLVGWANNIKAFQYLWPKMKRLGFKVMKLRHLNQDPIENLFGLIRQFCGSNTNPTTTQFISALKTSLITRFIKTSSTGKNCEDDEAYFLDDMRSLLDIANNEEANGTPTLVRGATLPNDVREKMAKISRQGPALACAIIASTVMQKSDCEDCLRLLTTSEKSTDLEFTIAQSSLQPIINTYPSPELINTFLQCQSSFKSSWAQIINKKNILEELNRVFEPHWAWFDCQSHESTKSKVNDMIGTCLVEKKCRQISIQLKAARIKKTRQIPEEQSQPRSITDSDFNLLYGISGECFSLLTFQ